MAPPDAAPRPLLGLSTAEERLSAADFFARFAWEPRVPDEEMPAGDFLDAL